MDEATIKKVWEVKPYTTWRVMCSCCGQFHKFDMAIQDVHEALINDGWELRRTGPWCAGCCDDQRRGNA